MTKNEALKPTTVYDELFSLINDQTGKVLLHSEMNDIINVVEKYSTLHTAPTTDGDAERALKALDHINFCYSSELVMDGKVQADFKIILTALQSTRKPLIDVELLIKETIPGGDICDPQKVADNIREYLREPVDTINIKREVLQGVKAQMMKMQVISAHIQSKRGGDMNSLATKALSSLDAVLAEEE